MQARTAKPLMLTARATRRTVGFRAAAALAIVVSCTAALGTLPDSGEGWIGRRLTIRLADPIPLAQAETAAPFALETPVVAGGAAPFHAGVQSVTDAARSQLCLTSAIYYEAASESEDGQRAVAQVVLNRVRHPAFPNSVCGVVFQGSERDVCQFSFTCDGAMLRQPSRAGWSTASRIAREALAGSVYAPVGMATHYHTLAVSPFWAPSLISTAIVGAHIFYRWPGGNGQIAAFRQAYAMREPMPGPYPKRVIASAPVQLTAYADIPYPVVPVASAPIARDVQPEYVASGAPLTSYQDSVADSQIRPEWRDSGTWIKR